MNLASSYQDSLFVNTATYNRNDIKEEIQGKITELSTALESDDPASIEASLQNLNSAIQQVGQEIYSNPEASTDESSQQEDPTSDSDDDNTVEGEFRQV